VKIVVDAMMIRLGLTSMELAIVAIIIVIKEVTIVSNAGTISRQY
jgi:hypothetical protein